MIIGINDRSEIIFKSSANNRKQLNPVNTLHNIDELFKHSSFVSDIAVFA